MQKDIDFFLDHDDLAVTGEAVHRLLSDGIPALKLMQAQIESEGGRAAGLSYVLGLSSEPESTAILEELLVSDDEEVRLYAAVDLAVSKHNRSGVDVLYEEYANGYEEWPGLIEEALFSINQPLPKSTESSSTR